VPGPGWTEISDPDDPRLDPYRDLRDAAARRQLEGDHGLFVAEGVTVIARLLQSPYPVRSALLLPARAAALSAALTASGADVFVAERDVLAEVAGFDVHRGALAIAARLPPSALRDVVDGARTVAVLEGLTDHENLGALVRSASALGVDALVLDATCADPLYRRCVRVSMGEILFMPWTRATDWPAALVTLRAAGLELVALTPSPDAPALDRVVRRLGERVALILGSEGPGLSAATLAAADHRARIPLRAGVDSLNVGHAAAIAFHAVRRSPG
jgi:tRNA G18 (ribose-2'-O)-methylase SpoU